MYTFWILIVKPYSDKFNVVVSGVFEVFFLIVSVMAVIVSNLDSTPDELNDVFLIMSAATPIITVLVSVLFLIYEIIKGPTRDSVSVFVPETPTMSKKPMFADSDDDFGGEQKSKVGVGRKSVKGFDDG